MPAGAQPGTGLSAGRAGETGLAPGAELHRLMVGWRQRLDPAGIPGLAPAGRRGVSQETVAHLVGVSLIWYRRLEHGQGQHGYSDDLLDRVAYALRLTGDERRVLYLLALGREPAPPAPPADPALSPALVEFVQRQPWPTEISDAGWQVLAYNDRWAAWFPHTRYERNIMRWVFLHPQSRLQLVDWEGCWAPRMLAQMRAANSRWPGHPRITTLISECLAGSEFARTRWAGDPTVIAHPDGDRRRLHIPYDPTVREVEILACAPLRSPDLRLVTLAPLHELPGSP